MCNKYKVHPGTGHEVLERESGFGRLVVSMLASDFSGEKFLSMPSFGRKVKTFALFRRFAACQRTL
jgi:hypothetical protein